MHSVFLEDGMYPETFTGLKINQLKKKKEKKTITVNCFSFGLMLCSFLVNEVMRQEEYCESCIAFPINQCQYIYFLVTQS